MQLDDLFEDLEAQFDFALSRSIGASPTTEANLIRVRCLDGRRVELVLPIIGEDFLAGMALGDDVFQLLFLKSIAQVEFCHLNGLDLQKLRTVDQFARDFFDRMTLPVELTWAITGSLERHRGVLTGIRGGLLMMQIIGRELEVGIPLSSLTDITIASVDNLST
jgi:hypothetical protein